MCESECLNLNQVSAVAVPGLVLKGKRPNEIISSRLQLYRIYLCFYVFIYICLLSYSYVPCNGKKNGERK